MVHDLSLSPLSYVINFHSILSSHAFSLPHSSPSSLVVDNESYSAKQFAVEVILTCFSFGILSVVFVYPLPYLAFMFFFTVLSTVIILGRAGGGGNRDILHLSFIDDFHCLFLGKDLTAYIAMSYAYIDRFPQCYFYFCSPPNTYFLTFQNRHISCPSSLPKCFLLGLLSLNSLHYRCIGDLPP